MAQERRLYTVGWICALQTEYVAACELLDEELPPLQTALPNDNNAYTLGRINDHYIVIACLPKGRYGLASAASVAKDMLRSFDSIRVGLMVGIGGAAPSDKHDIRLGDVVVGCPVKKEGGVIPYNFGKAVQEMEFVSTGSLNSPPTVLLTNLTKLSAYHERKGNHIAESVRKMVAKNQRLGEKYQHPGVENDRLYESSYTHRGGDDRCEICCDQASPPVLQRLQRLHDLNEPVVHYGLIASADTLMKDAIARDRLIKKHDILCFEMEAAGLMNDFPCVVIRGICDYSDSHKNDMWQGYATVAAASYAKELLGIIPAHQIASTQTATAEMVKPLFSVPYERDANFIERKNIFVQIEKQLHMHHRASICGIGGVGKSQIAIEYAYRFRQSRPQSHVFWVYAASSGTVLQACHEIARSLQLPTYEDPKSDSCELVSRWLKEDDRTWLLILDNADDADVIFASTEFHESPATVTQTHRPLIDYLPSILIPQKLLLVTTRNKRVGQDLAHGELCVEVPPFSCQEARALLRSKVKGATDFFDVSSTERLLEVLGHIPLAITQAAAFINHNGMTVEGYLTALETDKQDLTEFLSHELQDHRRQRGFPNSVFRTWKFSFDQILTQEPQTAKLLSLLAMLDPRRIPEKLVRRSIGRELDFRTAIGTLNGFALITPEIGGEIYAIHPLVQASVHYWLEQRNEKANYVSQALELLAKEFPHGIHENKETCESLLAHAQAVLNWDYVSKDDDQRYRADLLYNVGSFHSEQGRFGFAYQEVSEAHNIDQKRLGEDAPGTLHSLSILALTLRDQGEYKKAEDMSRRVLAGFEKVLGVEHPDTLFSANKLALALPQEKYKTAEDMSRRALEGMEKVLGVEHPYTLSSVHDLSSVLFSKKDYKAAEQMSRRALEGREKVLGLEHPYTLDSVHHLSSVLFSKKDYKAAEQMSRRALEGREKVLGLEHPNTLTSVHGLSFILFAKKDYKAAEEMSRRALEGREKVLGNEHPSTVITMSSLAYLYHLQQLYDEASTLYLKALAGLTKTLGPDHPATRRCHQNYSSMVDERDRNARDPNSCSGSAK